MFRPLLTVFVALLSLVALASPRAEAADSGDAATVKQISETFLKGYLTSKNPQSYLLKSPEVTEAAKSSLQSIIKKAGEDGLETDPVTGGQDFPKHYNFVVGKVTADKATVSAEAKEFPTIHFRLVKEKNGWKIDGAGDVNKGH